MVQRVEALKMCVHFADAEILNDALNVDLHTNDFRARLDPSVCYYLDQATQENLQILAVFLGGLNSLTSQRQKNIVRFLQYEK